MSSVHTAVPTPQTAANLLALFFDQAERLGDHPFLWTKQGGIWRSQSWREVAGQVAKLAGALRDLGLGEGRRVVLVSENRPEWLIADLAIMAAGGITVPAYTSNTERDHAHVLENSEASAVIVSTPNLARTLLPAVHQSAHCHQVIVMAPVRAQQMSGATIHQWDALVVASSSSITQARGWSAGLKRTDLACLIYTSGTGGAPRGVRQHHGAILHNIAGAADIVQQDFPPQEDVFLSFLPLSHAYEHTGGQFLPIALGGQIYYAESLDKLASNIEEVRPTIIVVVPRLFEVLRARLTRAIEKQGAVARFLFTQALHHGDLRAQGGALPLWRQPLAWLIDRTLRRTVRAKFGNRLKALVSGGAPLNPAVGRFFEALGLTLLQGYGQTEAAPIIAVNRPSAGIRMDSVGPPLTGVELRIAADGEICVRGELVTAGYWRNEVDTALILQDGWLHTGDIGYLDCAGRLVITDRKKDIIVNDKGDNISPQRVEGMLTLEPEIAQAMVVGDKRPYLVALVVPDADWLKGWAAAHGHTRVALEALRNDPELTSALMAAVDRVNARLAPMERVRRILVADAPFSIENEQMTPTMKIRRHILKQVYGERLAALYR